MSQWIGIGVLAAVVIWLIGIYNRLISYRNQFKNAFAQIDVQLKRRYDLIPNLVETAKAYMKHEKSTLEAVIQARNAAAAASQAVHKNAASPEAMRSLLSAESALAGQLKQFIVQVEAYPELKADHTMTSLMEELTSTENKVSYARQAFNDLVMNYNTACEVFPNSIIANFFSFKPGLLFEIGSAVEREPIKVAF
jgi:LemA protein